MADCPEGFRWHKDTRKVRGGYCRDITKSRAAGARYDASEKRRAAHARSRAKRDADPIRRIRKLIYMSQWYRKQRIARLEQQLKEL